jgi:preprotein translocase subunit YajC
MLNDILLSAVSNPGSSIPQYILIGGIVVVFYFFMIRPQQRRQREQRNFLKQIEKGEQLITIGGIHGKVYEVAEDTVTLEIDSKGSKVTVSKGAISLESSRQNAKNKGA